MTTAVNHKKGDIVRITKCQFGHMFRIGSLVKINSVGIDSNGAPRNYTGECLSNHTDIHWSFEDSECEATYDVKTARNRQAKSLLSQEY